MEDEKYSASSKAAQLQLFAYYEVLAKRRLALPSIFDVGFRVFSQFEEDGILLFLFAVLGMRTKLFVDIGAGDGVTDSNCANLAINFGWHGLFIDRDESKIMQGVQIYSRHPDTFLYPPIFKCATVTRENVNQIIREAGFEGEVDLLSIDIDGNDYWIWKSLECIQPRVVIIETHVEFGNRNLIVPYDANYVYPGPIPDYRGASPVAMMKLAESKGYRLVGANRFGFNTLYLRNEDGVDLIPTVSAESILRHPRNKERSKVFDAIKDMAYVQG
jgi:hypothetical protein